ncbi:MAG: hypothetical protein ACP5SB_04830, partial [Caldisericaceae bacterium]
MKIAPKELVWKDFKRLQREVELKTEPMVEDLLFMQTIEGHSHNGDGAFNGDKYVDTTINDIVEILGRDTFIVRAERQMLIDEIYEFANRIIKGEELRHLVNANGEPLMRCPLFLKWEIEPKEVLKGLYLGGLMDDFETRKKVNEKYKTNLGGGKPYLVDMRVMEKLGLNGEMLAHGDHEDKLDEYRKEGLIIDPSNVDFLRHSDIRFQYIRHKKGLGVSDDLAIIMGGLLYNTSVAFGAYLADAIDTLDKFALKFIEQDDYLSNLIANSFKGLNISDEEVYKYIYLISIPEDKEKYVPDSSQRYFLEIDKEAQITTLESHYNFLKGLPIVPFKIAYERILNTVLY